MLASVYLGLERPADALALLAQALPTSDDKGLLNIAARAQMNLKQYDKAAATYERAIAADPAFPQSHVGRG